MAKAPRISWLRFHASKNTLLSSEEWTHSRLLFLASTSPGTNPACAASLGLRAKRSATPAKFYDTTAPRITEPPSQIPSTKCSRGADFTSRIPRQYFRLVNGRHTRLSVSADGQCIITQTEWTEDAMSGGTGPPLFGRLAASSSPQNGSGRGWSSFLVIRGAGLSRGNPRGASTANREPVAEPALDRRPRCRRSARPSSAAGLRPVRPAKEPPGVRRRNRQGAPC